MNVLSLFDGISCGQIALNRANIKYEKYYSSEIDNYSIKVTQHNYPNTIQLGDILNWKDWDINWSSIGLLMGGFPCQSFSSAGKGMNFEDQRGQLFFILIDIFNHIKNLNPTVTFLFENVKMKKEWINIINSYIGVSPILINSSLLSAQNRERNYWTNIGNIPQPLDKNIFLKDIIENGVVDRDKSFCIDANYWKGGNLKSYFEKHRRQLIFMPLATSERGRRLTSDGTKRDDKNGIVVRGYEVRPDGKTCALTTVLKDNYVTEDFVIRKLTPIEAERLQTINDNYTSSLSNSRRYRCIGNGWTVDIIAHIFSFLKQL